MGWDGCDEIGLNWTELGADEIARDGVGSVWIGLDWIGIGMGWDGIGIGLGLDWDWIGIGLGWDWMGLDGIGWDTWQSTSEQNVAKRDQDPKSRVG